MYWSLIVTIVKRKTHYEKPENISNKICNIAFPSDFDIILHLFIEENMSATSMTRKRSARDKKDEKTRYINLEKASK